MTAEGRAEPGNTENRTGNQTWKGRDILARQDLTRLSIKDRMLA
jgi:hypothetical protein